MDLVDGFPLLALVDGFPFLSWELTFACKGVFTFSFRLIFLDTSRQKDVKHLSFISQIFAEVLAL